MQVMPHARPILLPPRPRSAETVAEGRLRARLAALPPQMLVDVCMRATQHEAGPPLPSTGCLDHAICELAPLPAWCSAVLLSVDLGPYVLEQLDAGGRRRVAFVCSVWRRWREETVRHAAASFVEARSQIANDAPCGTNASLPTGFYGAILDPAVLARLTTLRPQLFALIASGPAPFYDPDAPVRAAFGMEHLLEQEVRALEGSWMAGCGFSLRRASSPGSGYHHNGERVTSTWVCTIPGIDGTLMDGGLFTFDIGFTDTYPRNPPRIALRDGSAGHSGMYHCNLYASGKVCSMVTVEKWWHCASWSVVELLLHLLLFLHRNNNWDPTCEPTYRTFRSDRAEFNRMVRAWAVASSAGWQQAGLDAATRAPLPQEVVDAVLRPGPDPQFGAPAEHQALRDALPLMDWVALGRGKARLLRTAFLPTPVTVVGDVVPAATGPGRVISAACEARAGQARVGFGHGVVGAI